MAARACHPSPGKAETGGSPGLFSWPPSPRGELQASQGTCLNREGGAGKMARWIQALTANSNNTNSGAGFHMVGGK